MGNVAEIREDTKDMLEIVIAVLPGILAFLVYRYSHQEFQWKKAILYILFYTAAANLGILVGLKLIGMQAFHLSEMSVGFKIKWIALEFVLSAWLTWVIRNIRKTDPAVLQGIMKRLFPAVLFFIVTYAVFTPSSLFLGNIDEFSLRYVKIVPILFCMALCLLIGIYLIAVWLIREKTLPFYMALIFGVTLGAYIQSNFLNAKLPILDGALIEWEKYRAENMISAVVWIFCIAAVLLAAYFGKEKFEKIVKYVSYFFSAVQIVSLVVLIVMNPLDSDASYGFSKEGEFLIGSEENIVIFIIDTLQEDVLEEYLASEAYTADGTLDDFTIFDNAVSGGAPTICAMPLLLTGSEYDPAQPFRNYLTEAWEETQLYEDLHQNGYDVRLYSALVDISGFPEGTFDNYAPIGDSWIDNYSGFGSSLYQLVNYLLMPQFLKENFWLSTETLLYNIQNTDYKINDIYFHNDFAAAGEKLQTSYEKAYRLYHLNGLHPPYSMTEDFGRVWDNGVAEQTVLRGDMRIIYAYIDEMKNLGVYDKSTIIIAGDHGRHSEGNPETNPAVLVKLPMEKHELTVNSAPIHFRNMGATIAGTFLEDYSAYGPSIYDITDESDVERMHTITDSIMDRINLKSYDENQDCCRLIVSGDADAWDYRLWNPYEINRIDYQKGDIIDFTSDNAYANQINYRLYKENGAATASNELSLCFQLGSSEKEDLEFHFVYSDLYNDTQKIQIYAGGNKVGNQICTRNEIGKEMVAVIPKDSIRDGLLAVRMVFPNAVTPNQLDRSNPDRRVLSVVFDSMWLE